MTVMKVGVFGSCRVHTPLKLFEKSGKISYIHDNIIGYMHYSSEIMQAISILKAEKAVSAELRPLLNFYKDKKPPDHDIFNQIFTDVDAYVIEISSIRVIEFNGYYLQIHRLREALAQFENGEEFAKNLYKRDTSALKADADIFVRNEGITGILAEVISNCRLYEQNAEQIKGDLYQIQKLLNKPIIFVGPFVKTSDDKPVKQRSLLASSIQEFSEICPKAIFFDPTDLVDEFGFNHALIDSGHYRPDFEPIAGERLGCAVRDVVMQNHTKRTST